MNAMKDFEAMLQLGPVMTMPVSNYSRLVGSQSQPVTLVCPDCNKRYMVKLNSLDALSPQIGCTCGYVFMGPS